MTSLMVSCLFLSLLMPFHKSHRIRESTWHSAVSEAICADFINCSKTARTHLGRTRTRGKVIQTSGRNLKPPNSVPSRADWAGARRASTKASSVLSRHICSVRRCNNAGCLRNSAVRLIAPTSGFHMKPALSFC